MNHVFPVVGSGIEIEFQLITTKVAMIAIASLGIAGTRGGATNAALVVLISIAPLIDMPGTALTISCAITSGFVAREFYSVTKKNQAI